MQVRVPRIAREVLERGDWGPRVHDDLEDLAREIEGDAPVPPPRPPAADVESWHRAQAQHANDTWLDTEWFYAELAFYREVATRCRFWETGRDPFEAAKQEELAGERPWQRLDAALGRRGTRDERLLDLLEEALWGNRVDLSYKVAASRERTEGDLIVDDRAAAVPLLARPGASVHLVTDNTGTELALDLAIASAVLEENASRVVLHVKMQPVFVSDAITNDVWRLIEAMRGLGGDARILGTALAEAFDAGRLDIAPDPFWSSPWFLWQAPGHIVDALRHASVVVLKGDANYRRLIGDALWPPSAPLAAACSYISTPIVCLRTMKSDPVLGLPEGLAERLDASEPEWRIDGRRGLVQTFAPESDA
jgi:uncharacterized protein with ATP-grasp and redox domains